MIWEDQFLEILTRTDRFGLSNWKWPPLLKRRLKEKKEGGVHFLPFLFLIFFVFNNPAALFLLQKLWGHAELLQSFLAWPVKTLFDVGLVRAFVLTYFVLPQAFM